MYHKGDTVRSQQDEEKFLYCQKTDSEVHSDSYVHEVTTDFFHLLKRSGLEVTTYLLSTEEVNDARS